MKFISVSMVKDEGDIIELFIRINSRVIDHFFIVDNGSSDNTVRILEKLILEGFKITIYKDPTPEYNQSLITTKALRSATAATKYDWAFILDADEFINIEKSAIEKELSSLPTIYAGALSWSTWIPKGDVWYNYDNPLWSVFRRKKEEVIPTIKVIVPYRMAHTAVLEMGNHNVYISLNGSYNLLDGAQLMQPIKLKCGVLDHVPVRSSSQFLSKALIGSLKLSLTKNRKKYEAYHWDNSALMIMKNNFKIDDLLLRYLAITYQAKPEHQVADEVDEDSRFGLETDVVKYKKLYTINETARFFHLMVAFTNRFRND